MKLDLRPYARTWRTVWLILPAALLLALVLGALLGLQPMLLLPFAGLALVLGVLAGGAVVARRALPGSNRWQPVALLVLWGLVVNVPTFLAFDPTGFSHNHGLFNAQSISRIAVFAIGAALTFGFWVLWSRERRTAPTAATPLGAWLLFSLYLWYVVQAPLVSTGLSAALAIFRAMEWLVAFFLLFLVMRGQSLRGRTTFQDRLRLVLPMLLLMMGSSLLLLLVRPDMAYQRSMVTGISRLVGPFTHPNLLAIVATMLFAYGLVSLSGWQRWLLSSATLAVVYFAYSRGGFVAFAATCAVGLFIALRGIVTRLLAVVSVLLAVVLASQVPAVSDGLSRFLSRGNEREGLSTLSERTAVWQAAKIMMARSPLLGEGFIAGPKELGDVMLRNRLSMNFAAPHAHNEFLQAQISGGIIALLLSLAIHLRVFYLLAFRAQMNRREAFFLWTVFVNVVSWGLLAPSLSYFLLLPGILLGWLLLTLEGLSASPQRQPAHLTQIRWRR